MGRGVLRGRVRVKECPGDRGLRGIWEGLCGSASCEWGGYRVVGRQRETAEALKGIVSGSGSPRTLRGEVQARMI